jgi:hypothetical protein
LIDPVPNSGGKEAATASIKKIRHRYIGLGTGKKGRGRNPKTERVGGKR